MTGGAETRRRISNLLAADGFTEVLSYPFTNDKRDDQLRLESDDVRRKHVRLANPMSEDLPLMRTNLLSTLVELVARNYGRGAKDVALFEAGLVSTSAGLPDGPGPRAPARLPPTRGGTRRGLRLGSSPSPTTTRASSPATSKTPASGARAARPRPPTSSTPCAALPASTASRSPSKPTRSRPGTPDVRRSSLLADGQVLGHAGELHPKVCENLGLPARTVAFEIDLDALLAQEDLRTWDGALSTYPVSRQDVALIVDVELPTQTLAATLREGAGEELELLETFDLYTGDQLPEGKKSLAFRLTFRAADRTLKADDASAMREAATQLAADRHGAEVRS